MDPNLSILPLSLSDAVIQMTGWLFIIWLYYHELPRGYMTVLQ